MPSADPSAQALHVAAFVLDGDLLQGAGVVQGGVVAGLLGDAVDAFAAGVVGPERRAELETLDVSFERAARPGPCTVRATLVRDGRTLQVWDARLVGGDGRTVASARTTHRVTHRVTHRPDATRP